MWIRLRLDIGWNDLFASLLYCLLPASRKKQTHQTLKAWSSNDDCLITLSVRSAFDVMLRALDLPKGSEVMMTALTVPGMIRIVEEHGLIPVPIDIDESGKIIESSFQEALSEKTKLFVIAHLFGNRFRLKPFLPTLKRHNILIAEDCAQSFDKTGEQGDSNSDFVLHSFGPIKTCTALSGGIVRVNNPQHLETMRKILKSDPVSSRFKFLRRTLKFFFLKAISGRITFSLLKKFLEAFQIDYDQFLNNLGYSFSKENFFEQIRQQPSTPLIRLLRRRWVNYDFNRIERRKTLGQKLDEILNRHRSVDTNYWIYPIYSDNRKRLCENLRKAGLDATHLSRLAIVLNSNQGNNQPPENLLRNWERIVFIPWYPDLSDEALEKMGSIIHVDSTSR